MAVMFTTQQGRTLVNYDMSAEDVTSALGMLVEITGLELGSTGRPVFHVNTRHVVEWWDKDAAP